MDLKRNSFGGRIVHDKTFKGGSIEYKMKRGLNLLFFLVLALPLFGSFAAATSYEQNFTSTAIGASSIAISSLRYEPYPVEPNEQFTLWIKIVNIGPTAIDARCRIVQQQPFYVYRGDSEKDYGILGTRDFAVFSFSIKVDPNAVDGQNELDVECTANPTSGWIRNKIMITVQTRYPTLNIINVKTVPDFIEPGSKAQLLISLENSAYTSMKDVNVKPDFSQVPIAPYQEMGQKKISRIAAGEIKDIIFNVIAMPDATGGIYKLPVTITYTDELGTPYSLNGTIALEINSNPDLIIYVDSSELTSTTRTGNVIFKIVNKGLTDLKYVTARLMESKQMKIISGNEMYIGKLDSDDFETAEFRVQAKSSKMVFPVELEYRDINNRLHDDQFNVTYNLASPSELGKGSSLASKIFLMIIFVAGIFAYVKRKMLLEKLKSFSK